MNSKGLSTGERAMLRHEIHCDLVEDRARRLAEEAQERDELVSLYSDMFKDRNGVRPRHVDFRTISLADLRRKVDELAATPLPSDDEFV